MSDQIHELVVRIDLGDMLNKLPEKVVEEKTVIPPGYRCQDCWKGDGSHETTCPFYNQKEAT